MHMFTCVPFTWLQKDYKATGQDICVYYTVQLKRNSQENQNNGKIRAVGKKNLHRRGQGTKL